MPVISRNVAQSPHVLSTAQFGVRADARSVEDAAITSGTATLTSATASFGPGDVGKVVSVAGAGSAGATLASSITAVVNATTVTLAANASTTVSGKWMSYGTDDSDAITAWLTAVNSRGAGAVGYIHGLSMVTQGFVQNGGTRVYGAGWDYTSVAEPPQRGSGLIWAGSPTYGYQVGNLVAIEPGNTCPLLEDVAFFGYGLPTAVLKTHSARTRCDRVQVFWGRTYGAYLFGQNTRLYDSVVGQNLNGHCVIVANSDVKIGRCEIRQGGDSQVYVLDSESLMLHDTHLFTGSFGSLSGVPSGCINLLVESGGASRSGILAVNNTFDGTTGPHIKIRMTSAHRYGWVTVTGNNFYQVGGFPGGQFAVMEFDGVASSTIREVNFTGNTIWNRDTTTYTYMLENVGSATLAGITANSNAGGYFEALANFVPTNSKENSWFDAEANATRSSSPGGKQTFSGDGVTTAFTWSHLMGATTPSRINITPGSSAARGDFHVTATSTQITVTYATAPASGTNNVVLYWEAGI